MKIKKFTNFINENVDIMSYPEAFESFVKNQRIIQEISYGYGNLSEAHGYGFELENGYKYISYGGGCSGYDCNTKYILDPNDNLIAKEDEDGI